MSTAKKATVVRYKLRSHPNADALSIADIEGSAWQVVVRTEDFEAEGAGIYIPVDTVVPETEEFEFLKSKNFRIKAIRLRGEYSYGLLIPNREGLPVGEDVTDKLGIKQYEPPVPIDMSGDVERAADWVVTYTDIERYENYPDVLVEGEEVVVTEKIHGSNLRVTRKGDRLFVGGHNRMFKESEKSLYWRVIRKQGIDESLMQGLPEEVVLFGEAYGRKVQNLSYGQSTQQVVFYDAFKHGRYFSWDETAALLEQLGLSMVPLLYRGNFSLSQIRALATGPTCLGAEHMREGVVVKPLAERTDAELGRVILKFLNPEYETSKGRTDRR